MGNILVVDDDANIRKLISVNLKKRGYSTSEAINGKEAMSLLRQDPVADMSYWVPSLIH